MIIKFIIFFLCASNALMIFEVIPENITYVKVSLSSALALLYYCIYVTYKNRSPKNIGSLSRDELNIHLQFISSKGFEFKITLLALLVINIYSTTLDSSGYPQNIICIISLLVPSIVLYQLKRKLS
jgi:hypothetical protein